MNHKFLRVRRLGLTLLEVLFSMAIILVGLVGIGLLVPFAARQANESQTITQSTASGVSILGLADSASVFAPSEEIRWQIIDDVYPAATSGDSNHTVFSSFRDLYTGSDVNPAAPVRSLMNLQFQPKPDYPNTYNNPNNAVHVWANMNRAIGTCFYMDPYFWGHQDVLPKVVVDMSDPNPLFRRTRFPYYDERFSPSPLTGVNTPRLVRVSLRDSNWPLTTNDYRVNGGWLKLGPSRALATSFGGDLNQAAKTGNTTIPIRDFLATEDNSNSAFVPALIKASPSGTRVPGSWGIMVCPDDDTPIIPLSSVPSTGIIPTLPEHYNISVVVYGKRDARELSTSFAAAVQAGMMQPQEELLASVTWDPANDQPMTSGIFEVQLTGSPSLEPKIVSGDWMMLSRYVVHFDSATSFFVLRQRHKWYRVVNSPSEDRFPMTVRLAGLPWDWTSDELRSAAKVGTPITNRSLMDSTLPTFPFTRTVATIVPNVVHVYQRTVSLK